MNTQSDWLSLLPLLALLLIIVGSISPFLLKTLHEFQDNSDASWKQLAQDLNLKFSPRLALTGPVVSGTYCGHEMELSGVFIKQGKQRSRKTKITFSIPNPRQLNTDSRPTLSVANINTLFSDDDLAYSVKGHYWISEDIRQIVYSQPGFEKNIDRLNTLLDLQSNLSDAYPAILELGSQIMPTLQNITLARQSSLQHLAKQLMEIIAQDTTRRLADQHDSLVCPSCLTWFQAHDAQYDRFKTLRYYGCSTCRQSQRYFVADEIIAILDESMQTKHDAQNGNLRINWLKQQRLFDFDRVEIKQASDEAVERFAMQVGNDTDAWRRDNYAHVHCEVSSECDLSENTRRILARTFGEVILIQD